VFEHLRLIDCLLLHFAFCSHQYAVRFSSESPWGNPFAQPFQLFPGQRDIVEWITAFESDQQTERIVGQPFPWPERKILQMGFTNDVQHHPPEETAENDAVFLDICHRIGN
jgi:hypothetical protein